MRKSCILISLFFLLLFNSGCKVKQAPILEGEITKTGENEYTYKLNWNKVEKASLYEILISSDEAFTDTGICKIYSTVKSFYSSKTNYNTIYCKVMGKTVYNKGPWSNILVLKIEPEPEINAPVLEANSEYLSNGNFQYSLSWNQVQGTVIYELQKSDYEDFSNFANFKDSNGNVFKGSWPSGTVFIDNGLSVNSYFRVRAWDDLPENGGIASEWSNTCSASIKDLLVNEEVLFEGVNWKIHIKSIEVEYNPKVRTYLEGLYRSSINEPFAQYVSFDLTSGYIRTVYGNNGVVWGSSAILVPSFFGNGTLYQGIENIYIYNCKEVESFLGSGIFDLDFSFYGSYYDENDIFSCLIDVSGNVTVCPPVDDSLSTFVNIQTFNNNIDLDTQYHIGEAFQPVKISSMYHSSDYWDTNKVFVDDMTWNISRDSNWLIKGVPLEGGASVNEGDAVRGSRFGVIGGASAWQEEQGQNYAPTVFVDLLNSGPFDIKGWIDLSAQLGVNDDNIGLWAASDYVLSSWNYEMVSSLYTNEYKKGSSKELLEGSSDTNVSWR